MNTMTGIDTTVADVLDGWKDAIARHDPEGVAGFFTDDAVFQGLRPEHSVGRQGVADYYASQPLGLTATYTALENRRLSDDVISGYQLVDFDFTDRASIRVHLSIILERISGSWLISHYHVSRVG